MKSIKRFTCSIAIGLTLIAQLFSPITVYADGETPPPATDHPGETTNPDSTELQTEIIAAESPTADDSLPGASPEAEAETPEPTDSTPEPVETAVAEDGIEVEEQATVLPVETGTPEAPAETNEPTDSTPVAVETATAEESPDVEEQATVLPVETGTPEPPAETMEPTDSTPEPVETATAEEAIDGEEQTTAAPDETGTPKATDSIPEPVETATGEEGIEVEEQATVLPGESGTPEPPAETPEPTDSTPEPVETATAEDATEPTDSTAEPVETATAVETIAVEEQATVLPVETGTPEAPAETIEPTDSTPNPVETAPAEEATDVEEQATAAPVEAGTPESPAEILEPTDSTQEPVEAAAAEEVLTVEEPTLADALQELPDETDVVVLDENGQPVPLVTTEAAEIIESSDPMWCPEGVAPGGTDCTTSYPTMAALLAALTGTNQPTQDGRIWITSGDVGDANPVVINGLTYPIWANNALTLQGGWGGGGNSVFSVPITISNWLKNITVNNITVNRTGGDGLTISDSQDVTIEDSNFSWNSGSGVKNYKSGNITINSGTFSNNTMDGVNNEESGNITIKGGTFSGNDRHGVRNIYSGDITIHDGTFSWNGRNGVTDYGSTGTVTIHDGTFSNNTEAGVYTDLSPSFTIHDGEFSENVYGVSTYAGYFTIDDGEFRGNDYGVYIWISYDITITGGEITENDYGVYVLSCESNLSADMSTIFNNSIDVRLPPGCEIIPIEESLEPITYFQSQGEFELDCIGESSFAVDLPNGDLVNIFCPVSGTARIYRLDNTTLPAELPAGYTYASAYTLDIIQDGEPIPVIREGGYIKASFVAQPLQPGNTYAVLYWDKAAETWMELKDFLQKDESGNPQSFDLLPGDPGDGRIILSGVNLVTRKGAQRVEVSTNFPGVFVLAQH